MSSEEPARAAATDARHASTAKGNRVATVLLVAAVALGIAVLATRRGPPAQNPPVATDRSLQPADVIVELDGIQITWGDLADQVAWLDELAPEYSVQKKVQVILPEHTIPVLFARREFAAQREELRQLAATIRHGTDNVRELEKNAEGRTFRRAPMTRGDMTVPVARFVFDENNVGGVSQPIEVPMGFVLAGAFDIQQSRVPMEDVCDVGMLGFFTHDDGSFAEWSDRLRERLRTRVTYVHPDFRLAMPPWLQLP